MTTPNPDWNASSSCLTLTGQDKVPMSALHVTRASEERGRPIIPSSLSLQEALSLQERQVQYVQMLHNAAYLLCYPNLHINAKLHM